MTNSPLDAAHAQLANAGVTQLFDQTLQIVGLSRARGRPNDSRRGATARPVTAPTGFSNQPLPAG